MKNIIIALLITVISTFCAAPSFAFDVKDYKGKVKENLRSMGFNDLYKFDIFPKNYSGMAEDIINPNKNLRKSQLQKLFAKADFYAHENTLYCTSYHNIDGEIIMFKCEKLPL